MKPINPMIGVMKGGIMQGGLFNLFGSFYQDLVDLGLIALYSSYQIPGQSSTQPLMEVTVSGTPTDFYKFNPSSPRQYNSETLEANLYPSLTLLAS